jgi:hypothetical protein
MRIILPVPPLATASVKVLTATLTVLLAGCLHPVVLMLIHVGVTLEILVLDGLV